MLPQGLGLKGSEALILRTGLLLLLMVGFPARVSRFLIAYEARIFNSWNRAFFVF